MKWQIWIEPNQIIEEEYPAGWSHYEVMEAASARWANKVTTVNPAPTGMSNSNDSTMSGYSSFNLGFIPTVILGAVVIGFLGMFGGNEQQPTNPEPTLQQKIQERKDNGVQETDEERL